MDNAQYLKTALAVLRDHPPGLDYRGSTASDPRTAFLFAGLVWDEPAALPKVLGREYQEALGAYLARIGARPSLPETVLTASPYGDVEDVVHRRLLIDAADDALSAR